MALDTKNIDGCFYRISDTRFNKLEDDSVLALLNKADIIFLIETHCNEDDNLAIKNFAIVKNNRKKLVNARKSSGGLAVCIRKEIRSGIKILPFTNSEFIWIKLCKTFFNLNSDIYICGTYIASQGSSYNVRSDDLFTIIEQDIVSYSTKGMCMICGDLNGYTGTEPDFILDDNSNFLPLPYNYCSDTFLDRSNRDIRNPNLFGNKILELCKNT